MDHILEEHAESIDMEHVADSAMDTIQQGVIVQGEIVTIDNEFAYINVGTKSDGRISLEEFDEKPQVGSLVYVMLKNKRLVDGVYHFSKGAADQERHWQIFINWYSQGNTIIKGRVRAATNKGKLVECENGLTTFLPFSLAADLKGESSTEDLREFIVKSVDEKKRSVILSRKDFLDIEKKQKWDSFLSRYKAGDHITGEVVKFVEFGAFIRVEGLDGLLHRNDMSWKNVFKQRKILKLGEQREFTILGINPEENKISLGLKQLHEDPWLNIEQRYKPGTIVKGTVVTITNIGAFVELDDEVEGFVSNHELSWTKNNASARDFFQKNQELDFMVLDIRKEDHKLLLGYKQTQENPWSRIDEIYPAGAILTRRVKKIVKFGIFVELDNNIDGLIHVSDFSWDESPKDPAVIFKPGDEVTFKILEVRKDEMKIACGIKQLEKSPWEKISEKYPPRSKVEGIISGITPFGLFVRLDENIEGLIHISEVSRRRIDNLSDHFTVGDRINAIVLGVDPRKKRLSLSIKHFDMIEEKEELDRVLNSTSSPGGVTIGDMIKVKLGE